MNVATLVRLGWVLVAPLAACSLMTDLSGFATREDSPETLGAEASSGKDPLDGGDAGLVTLPDGAVVDPRSVPPVHLSTKNIYGAPNTPFSITVIISMK